MKPVDQAFFSAYGPDAVVAPIATNQPTARASSAGQVDRRKRGTAIERVYSDVASYRVDDAHSLSDRDRNAPTKPHFLSKQIPVDATATVGFDASHDNTESLRQLAAWQSSCLVIAAPYSVPPVELATENPPLPGSAAKTSPSATSSAFAEGAVPAVSAEQTTIGPILPSADPIERAEPSGKPLNQHRAGNQVVVSEDAAFSWTPVWEVDEFDWPEELVRLHESQAEYFRYAGEKLRDASREGLKLLAVVATREKEGCTTVATCLARAAAAVGTRVALVDANLAHPELGPKLGLDFSHGWQESLSGRTPIAEAAVVALETGLTLLPLSAAHRISSLHDAKIAQQLCAIAGSFDLVIIDAGVVPPGEVEMFEKGAGCPVNAALVVRDLRRTTETETLVTASRLKALGIEAVGIAENFFGRSAQSAAA